MCLPVPVTGFNREIDADDALIIVVVFEKASVPEDLDHPVVFGQNVSYESV